MSPLNKQLLIPFPAVQSAFTLVPSLNSYTCSSPCSHSHSGCVPTASLFCTPTTGRLRSCSCCDAAEWMERRTRAVGGMGEGQGLHHHVLVTEAPATSSPALLSVTGIRKHSVSLGKVQSSTSNLIWISPVSLHSFIFVSRMCNITFSSRLKHMLLKWIQFCRQSMLHSRNTLSLLIALQNCSFFF